MMTIHPWVAELLRCPLVKYGLVLVLCAGSFLGTAIALNTISRARWDALQRERMELTREVRKREDEARSGEETAHLLASMEVLEEKIGRPWNQGETIWAIDALADSSSVEITDHRVSETVQAGWVRSEHTLTFHSTYGAVREFLARTKEAPLFVQVEEIWLKRGLEKRGLGAEAQIDGGVRLSVHGKK